MQSSVAVTDEVSHASDASLTLQVTLRLLLLLIRMLMLSG